MAAIAGVAGRMPERLYDPASAAVLEPGNEAEFYASGCRWEIGGLEREILRGICVRSGEAGSIPRASYWRRAAQDLVGMAGGRSARGIRAAGCAGFRLGCAGRTG